MVDGIPAAGLPLKMDGSIDIDKTESTEVDPDLRARMEALMQHYLDTETEGDSRDKEDTSDTVGDSRDKEDTNDTVGEDTFEDVHDEAEELVSGEEEESLPLPAALPPVLATKPSELVYPSKPTGTNVKQTFKTKHGPPSEAVRHMVGLFGGNSLINSATLTTIGNGQLNITARMRQMSTQLREQNKISATLYADTSKDLEEYIGLLRRMKEIMTEVDSKLADIKSQVGVSEPDIQAKLNS